MFDDLTTAIKAQLYERATSPLLGSFIVSWCIINYKFLLVIFSSLTATEKITYIELNLFATPTDYLLKGFIGPLTAALALIIIYPYPAAKIYEIARTHRKNLKLIQKRIDDDTPITREEEKILKKKLANAEIEFETEINRKKNEISSLTSELDQQIEKNNMQALKITEQHKELETSNAAIEELKRELLAKFNEHWPLVDSVASRANQIQKKDPNSE
ncbi:hypothetical protein [Pseudomonas sp. xss_2]|uniref:hypothetical protein n=1 Tax=Pseudomonas sp. xss_2 TaxID=3367215 RepID=UPI00370BA2EC